jgi:trk system potassium uptake protein TrkA
LKAVFIGASSTAVMTGRILLRRGHEVVIVEWDKARIDALSDELSCAFLHGDGTRPAVLKETDPEGATYLFCLTDNDQANIIASLVGRSLGFSGIITKIQDPSFEHICIELGLTDTIIPSRTIGRFLADKFEGQDPLELSSMIKDEASVFSFVIREKDEKSLSEFELPDDTRIMCIYRNEKFLLPEDKTVAKTGDEVVVITHRRNLPALRERWTLVVANGS